MSELLLMCMIAGRRTAFPAVAVQSVIEIAAITPIPGAPDFIPGLTALRSQVLTVIDSPRALGHGTSSHAPGGRTAVVEVDGHPYALLVDEAFDVVPQRSDPTVVPGGFGAGWQGAALGMVETDDGPALLIDIAALVNGPAQVDA